MAHSSARRFAVILAASLTSGCTTEQAAGSIFGMMVLAALVRIGMEVGPAVMADVRRRREAGSEGGLSGIWFGSGGSWIGSDGSRDGASGADCGDSSSDGGSSDCSGGGGGDSGGSGGGDGGGGGGGGGSSD